MLHRHLVPGLAAFALAAMAGGQAVAQDSVKIGLILPMTGQQTSTAVSDGPLTPRLNLPLEGAAPRRPSWPSGSRWRREETSQTSEGISDGAEPAIKDASVSVGLRCSRIVRRAG